MARITRQMLIEQNAELLETNRQLNQVVPETIRSRIESSDAFVNFQKTVDEKTTTLESLVTVSEETTNGHVSALENSKNVHIETMGIKAAELDEIHQQHLDDCRRRTDELTNIEQTIKERIDEAKDLLQTAKNDFLDEITEQMTRHRKELAQAEDKAKKGVADEVLRFEELKQDFEALTSDSFNSKSSKLVVADYKENAKLHQTRESRFQVLCGASIIGAIIVLLVWLRLVVTGKMTTETEYHWLPVATVTSLFLFMSRWAARIAYRHGLEARRLNQYALDLTAMPAFFAQELLNQGDKEFQAEGKKIIQAKSAKMFGNIERFDEQHSHSPMELIWKWVTKKFETAEDESPVSLLSNGQSNKQPRNTARTSAKKPVSPSNE